jgi:Membrane bound FAD containing D-sorbitol dehydrogenase
MPKSILIPSLLALAALSACGIPRQAAQLAAQQQSLLAATPDDDAAIRAALANQPDAWISLSNLLTQRQLGGIAVNADFSALVEQAAALAQRQKTLIDAAQDDPVDNRRALQAMQKMWGDVKTYMGE